jgi:anti-sigma regulatory factor (Ser/Thr protein kinase)
MDRQLVFELPNDLGCIEDAVEFVLVRCAHCDEAARRLRFNFRVSLAEALANAMVYGNGGDPLKRVRVEVAVDRRRIEARVIDQGPGFDPRCIPDPTSPEHLHRPCGRGIFLMRKLMDEVRFNERGNAVTLVLSFIDQEARPREASA